MRTLLLSSILLLYVLNLCAQQTVFVQSKSGNCNELFAGIYNYVSINAFQEKPIELHQIKATLYAKNRKTLEGVPLDILFDDKNNVYQIHPLQTGRVEFDFNLDGKLVTQKLNVVTIPVDVRLGLHRANTDAKITAGEFKVHAGIGAYIACCGYDGSCSMLGFEVIHMGRESYFARRTNKGGRFQPDVMKLIKRAKKGDVFIFKNIHYKCPGSEKHRAEDFVIEII